MLVGIALTAFGIQFFLCAHNVTTLAASWPHWVPFHSAPVYLTGLVLTLFGLMVTFRSDARMPALLIGFLSVLWFLLANLPPIARAPGDIGIWNNGVMNLGLAGCAFLAGCMSLAGSFGKMGRALLALALIVFGAEHFYYAHFVATLVPIWAPAHLFFAYATGVALFAAGIAFAFCSRPHVAALLSALMFLLWVVALHAPRVVHATRGDSANEWTSLFHAVAFAGASLVIAGMSREEPA